MAQYPTRNINDIDDLSRQTMNNKNNVANELIVFFQRRGEGFTMDGFRTSPRFPPRLPRKCNTKL